MSYSWEELSKKVETQLNEFSFEGNPPELYQPIVYTMNLGGKRIRPTLCLLANQLFGGDITSSYHLAMGIEVFHNFTLVHDDIMDNAPLRRGQDTVHKKWNTDIAILSGDVMMVKAYELFCKSATNQLAQLLSVFNKTAIEVCEGQQLDMNFESRDDVKLQEYIEMIRLKTAVLLACSLKVGAIQAGANDNEADLIYRFGEQIGIAFQIQDDYLDAYANPDDFGKRVGGDIIANKKTFLLLATIERANYKQKEELINLLSNKVSDDEKVEKVMRLYNELDIPKIAKSSMNEYYLEAMKSLSLIAAPKQLKQPLVDLAEQLMNRNR